METSKCCDAKIQEFSNGYKKCCGCGGILDSGNNNKTVETIMEEHRALNFVAAPKRRQAAAPVLRLRQEFKGGALTKHQVPKIIDSLK